MTESIERPHYLHKNQFRIDGFVSLCFISVLSLKRKRKFAKRQNYYGIKKAAGTVANRLMFVTLIPSFFPH